MSGGARVSIPANLRKTIQDIKEIAGDHSDEDILAVLKECKMDPNETAQKLLYLGIHKNVSLFFFWGFCLCCMEGNRLMLVVFEC